MQSMVAGKKSFVTSATHLPVYMAMGIERFGTTPGATDTVTWDAVTPTVAISADGSAQDLILTAAVYGNDNTTTLGSSYAGTWTYHFDVSVTF